MAGCVSGKPVDAAAAEDKAPVLLLLEAAAEDKAPVPAALAQDSAPEKGRDLDWALLRLLSGRCTRTGSAEIALSDLGAMSVSSVISLSIQLGGIVTSVIRVPALLT